MKRAKKFLNEHIAADYTSHQITDRAKTTKRNQ